MFYKVVVQPHVAGRAKSMEQRHTQMAWIVVVVVVVEKPLHACFFKNEFRKSYLAA